MSDSNSALPVRTQNNGDVVAKIGDGTTSSQFLAIDATGRVTIKLDDGNGNAITSQVSGAQRALDVGINVAGVQIDPRSIRALTATDVVTAQQGTSPWVTKDQSDGPVTPGTVASFSQLMGGQFNSTLPTLTTGQQAAIQVDSSGRILIGAGTATIGAVTQGTTPWVENLSQVGGSAIALGQTTMSASLPVTIASNQTALSTKDAADGPVAAGTAAANSLLGGLVFNTAAPTVTNGQQVALQGDSSGNLKVNLATPIPAGTNLIGGTNLFIGGTVASGTNPVPVSISTTTPGTAVQNYATTAAVAPAASTTLTYTVATGHTFNLQSIFASASGKIKVVVQIGATTIFAAFNSTANPNISIPVVTAPLIAAAGTVNVIITNLDLVAQDVYATVEGNQN